MLLVGLITLVTLGIYVMVGMSYPILEHNTAVVLGPLNHFSLVYPTGSSTLEPSVVSQIRAHPNIAQAMPENGQGLFINVPSLGFSSSFQVLGLAHDDVQRLIELCGLQIKEGRLPSPRSSEILLSEEIANTLGLHLGDQLDRSVDESTYGAILAPMTLVGILASPTSTPPAQRAYVAIASYEYLDSHELYAPRQSGLVVIAQPGHKAAIDTFVQTTIRSPRTHVETYQRKAAFMARNRQIINAVLGVVDSLVAIIAALVIGMINQIALVQRLPDLGVLHAIGHHKRRLIHHLTLETVIVAATGWLVGIALSQAALAWLKVAVYASKGVLLNLANPASLCFTLPIPLAVVVFAALSIVRVFARLDSINIVERGKLSVEGAGNQSRGKQASFLKPLSSLTFHLRHRRRGMTLIAGMGAMILGVAFPIFFFSPAIAAQNELYVNYLRHAAEVGPGLGRTVDPSVVTQIRAHGDVTRVIPAAQLELPISIPPVSQNVAMIYAVLQDDLAYLISLWGLQLREERLPRPYANEIVLTESLAMNRSLRMGDVVGRPVNDRDLMPTEMIVVGILASDDISLGFASLEYVESHELYAAHPTHLLVFPAKGRKVSLDRWLEQQVASKYTSVVTYALRWQEMQRFTRNLVLLFAAMEGIIAFVAAAALSALNIIFFAQRRDEFGVLYAVGRSHPWLVLRAAKETVGLVAIAWVIGAVVCVVGLVLAQAWVYAPIGLRLNVWNLTPWLFTFPIPLVVVAASTGTIARMLSRLDPVAVIERR